MYENKYWKIWHPFFLTVTFFLKVTFLPLKYLSLCISEEKCILVVYDPEVLWTQGKKTKFDPGSSFW